MESVLKRVDTLDALDIQHGTLHGVAYEHEAYLNQALECVALQHARQEKPRGEIPYYVDTLQCIVLTRIPVSTMSDQDKIFAYLDTLEDRVFRVTVRVSKTEKRGFFRSFKVPLELLHPEPNNPDTIVLRVIPRNYERHDLASLRNADNVVYVAYNGAYTKGPPWDVMALRYFDEIDEKHKLAKM